MVEHPCFRLCRATCVTLLLASAWPLAHSEEVTWVEAASSPPQYFSTSKLIPIFISGPSQLEFGVDPSSVTLGDDQVVRYVLVAKSVSGAMNVSFEGIHCKSATTKVFARWNGKAETWKVLNESFWRPMSGDGRGTRHASILAKGGMCDGPGPNKPLPKMIQELTNGKNEK